MNAERIVQLAFQLDCNPPEMALEFALMLAEHCAQIADETAAMTASPAGEAIREAFRIR